jgi:hypothetical protein
LGSPSGRHDDPPLAAAGVRSGPAEPKPVESVSHLDRSSGPCRFVGQAIGQVRSLDDGTRGAPSPSAPGLTRGWAVPGGTATGTRDRSGGRLPRRPGLRRRARPILDRRSMMRRRAGTRGILERRSMMAPAGHQPRPTGPAGSAVPGAIAVHDDPRPDRLPRSESASSSGVVSPSGDAARTPGRSRATPRRIGRRGRRSRTPSVRPRASFAAPHAARRAVVVVEVLGAPPRGAVEPVVGALRVGEAAQSPSVDYTEARNDVLGCVGSTTPTRPPWLPPALWRLDRPRCCRPFRHWTTVILGP